MNSILKIWLSRLKKFVITEALDRIFLARIA